MDSKQLIDTLTSHISLYNTSIPSPAPPNPNPRSQILRWFSSLPVPHRRSSLTVLHPAFLQILSQMQSRLLRHGPALFFLLPDLPDSSSSLPTLCFRRSRGLVSRVTHSNHSESTIRHNIRLFGSDDEERLDSMTVSEDLVADVETFVSIMDGVTGGGFLRGEETGSGSEWEETAWLKARGYYSVEAFVVNKLEFALRLSWLNSSGGKKRGAKLKERLSGAGVAANVFWRKKGCLDWWDKLDSETRKKIFQTVLGKAATSVIKETAKEENIISAGERSFSSKGKKQLRRCVSASSCQSLLAVSAADAGFQASTPSPSVSGRPISNIFVRLFVLQEICAMMLKFRHNENEHDTLFFSTLGSLHTISDYILRKFRGRLMVVSSDYIRNELLAGENVKFSMNKSSDKLTVSGRRGKGKSRNTKNIKSIPKLSGSNCAMDKSFQDHGCGLPCKEIANLKDKEANCTHKEKVVQKETLTSRVELDHAKGMADSKGQTVAKKSRKKGVKSKASSVIESFTSHDSKVKSMETISQSVSLKIDSTNCNQLPFRPHDSKARSTQTTSQSVSLQTGSTKCEHLPCDSTVCSVQKEISIGGDNLTAYTLLENCACKPNVNDNAEGTKKPSMDSVCNLNDASHLGCCITSSETTLLDTPVPELDSNVISESKLKNESTEQFPEVSSPVVGSPTIDKAVDSNEESVTFQRHEMGKSYASLPRSYPGSTSNEWPSVAHFNLPYVNSQHLPAATDRLHLDVGCNWRNHFHQSFVSTRHHAMSPSVDGGCNRLMPRALPASVDWPPMVRSGSRLTQAMTCNYDSGFIPRLQSTYKQSRRPHRLHVNGTLSDDERKFSGDAMDSCDFSSIADGETHWISEDEFEVHAISGRDYNQYFGGGVMYWNTSELGGAGCSRPPSLSSEDSSWAWHEADLNRAIDDMVGIPSTYSSNGLTSPPSGPFCSPFDPLGPGHQSLGYVMPGSDVTGKVNHPSSTQTEGVPEEKLSGSFTNSTGSIAERQNSDLLPYPILRPIIIPNVSRKGSRSEFKVNHDHKSPCVPLSRRDQPRLKRPPSPVVLCVPQAPCTPQFPTVVDSRKRRGFPIVRSGSSSPRHWGMRSWYHDGNNPEESGFCMDGAEVVWPSWRSKGLSATPMIQPLPGALLQDRLIAISQLALDQEHPDTAIPLQLPDLPNCPSHKSSLPLMQNLLHEEIDSFCKQVAAKNIIMKPCINWAVKRVARSLQVLWPRSRTNIFGSNATGLSLPSSDVDLVVCLPPVRNLEPIKEAGILEGRNGIKETCLQHAARYLANQEWVKNDSLKTVENTAIPIIMLVVEVPQDVVISSGNTSNEQTPELKSIQASGEESSSDHSDTVNLEDCSWKMSPEMKKAEGVGVESVRLDISFKSPSHTGLQTTELVRELSEQFPAATPLALVLKQFLADRSLDHSYSGGLSSYCLVLLITRFLQHEHHLGRLINQNLGSLFMEFLYFFGNVFDPRKMRISIQGSGVYTNRERGHSIDPIHIDDPLFPTNNVGKNCFRIHQCIKAFADAYSILENEVTCLSCSDDSSSKASYQLLQKIIPSIDNV